MFSKYLKTILNGGLPEDALPNPLEQGLAAYEAGDHDAALPLLQEGLLGEPHHLEALLALARIGLSAQRFEIAQPALQTALELDASNAQIYYMMGELCMARRDAITAEAYFKRTVHHDPEFTDAHIQLGIVASQSKRLPEAVKAFEQAIFLDRTAVVARYHLAQVCLQLKDHRRALTQLHLVKELQPNYAPVYMLQGDIFTHLGDYRQAVLEFSKAIELGVNDASVFWRLGQALLALSDKERALRAFQQVLDRNAQYWPALFEVAKLQEELKQYAQALESYERLVGVADYRVQAEEKVALIQKLLGEIAAAMVGDFDAKPAPGDEKPPARYTGPLDSEKRTRPL